MQLIKIVKYVFSATLLFLMASNALAYTNIGSIHGSQCHAKEDSSDIHNVVWGIENRSTSGTGKVTCAVKITADLKNGFTKGGEYALEVEVTTQDWEKENKCRARVRNSDATGVYTYDWVTNKREGNYENFLIVDEFYGNKDFKGRYVVVECQLHKRVSGKGAPTIRAINVYTR